MKKQTLKDTIGDKKFSDFWCDRFYFYDNNENIIESIWVPDMTLEQFDKYKDYVEFKDLFIGGDYVHNSYFKEIKI